MNFLVDNQLPLVLAQWITAQGHVAIHVLNIHLDEADDREIWHYAIRESMIIVTKDEDFAGFVLTYPNPTPVVWVRLGNCRNMQLLHFFASIWDQIEERLSAGDRLIEIG